ncbi:MAG: hypothetical protein FWG13_04810, partial [Leptospirales bacterium]|nr:hypothetical protein [Leptospirales bacterium]
EEKSEGEAETAEQNEQTEDSQESVEKAPDAAVQSDDDAPIEVSVQPVADDDDDAEHRQRVLDTLSEFRRELKQTINHTLDMEDMEHVFPAEALKQLQLIANIGASHAADSISSLISKQIGLSIPDVSITPVEKVPSRIGSIDDQNYIGGVMDIDDKFGSLILLFEEQMAFDLIDALYDSPSKTAGVIDDYGESILREITNIVGSTLLSTIAGKVRHIILPVSPTLYSGKVDKILFASGIDKNGINGNLIIMDAAFFFEDDRLLAHLLFMPRNSSADDFLHFSD